MDFSDPTLRKRVNTVALRNGGGCLYFRDTFVPVIEYSLAVHELDLFVTFVDACQ
jgi:hypothetical protein